MVGLNAVASIESIDQAVSIDPNLIFHSPGLRQLNAIMVDDNGIKKDLRPPDCIKMIQTNLRKDRPITGIQRVWLPF